jgi:DNA-binding NarL/FixJ family response regulator
LGAGAADVAQLVPEIGERLPDLPVLPVLAPEQARFRAFDHLAAFLRRAAAAQPLVLIFDDLHWADPPSLLLLEFVAHEVLDAPLVILGTYRDVEVGRQHPLVRTLAEVVRAGQSQRVTLRGLSERDVGRLVAAAGGVTPTAELIAAVYEETAGNPFFVHEVARLLAGEVEDGRAVGAERTGRLLPIPQSVRETIGRRLDRLSPACNEVLATAAAVGREFGLSVLARVSDLPREQVLEALAAAAAARLIEEVPRRVGGYRFGHALIRETLYDDLSTVQKVRLHRQIGLALETLYGSDPEPHLAELAHHFVQAAPGSDVERAVAYARRAGERAMALLAFEDAAAHFEMALQVLDLLESPDELLRCDLLLALATAQHAAGDARVRVTFLQAAQLARRLGATEHLARAVLGFSEFRESVWGLDDATRSLLEDALAALSPADSIMRTRLLVRLSLGLLERDTTRAAALAAEAEVMARRLDDPRALAMALHARRVEIFFRSDEFDEFLAISAEMTRLAEAAGDCELAWSALLWQNDAFWVLGDFATADTVQRRFDRLADESGKPSLRFWSPAFRIPRAVMCGRFADAEQLLAEALTLANPTEMPYLAHWEALQRFAVCRDRGWPVEIESVLQHAIATTRVERQPSLRAMLALLYCETGRVADARLVYEEIVADGFARLHHVRQVRQHWYHAVGMLAEVCAVLGDVERAAALYDLLLPASGRYLVCGGLWHVAGPASHYLGLLAVTLDRRDEAVRHFEDALAMNSRIGARPFVARTQSAFATMLARRDAPGDREQALRLTDEVLATANELGMVRLAAEVTALRSTMKSDRAEDVAGAAMSSGLTEREIDVLRLLAAGRSNPEIAAILFISAATARTHVSNIFAKLDVHSRTEAVDYAHRHGLLLSFDPAST